MPVYQSLKTFISSPNDVKTERDMVENVIRKINTSCKEILGLELETFSWQDLPPKTPKLPDKKIQNILNDEISKCNIFILILYKRYGSIEPGYKLANTEREVNIAINLLKKEKKIMLLSYFRNIPSRGDEEPQEKSVKELRQNLEYKGIWYRNYSTPNDFKELLTHDLYSTVLKYRNATMKHKALKKFWDFGVPERPTYPKLAIIYPSLERTFMGPIGDTEVWLNRLEPNIVFEDFKVLQKIEKTLRLIGFHDFRIYNTSNSPSDLHFMNRFWICLPRNTGGLQQAGHYEQNSKFILVRQEIRAESFIKWRNSLKDKDYIIVRSPLAEYLKEQRSTMDISSEWNSAMERIVAKDYAILARFQNVESNINMKEGKLQDYFLAGLRGLGTWGAGWFIDRNYNQFLKYKDDQNIQLLLEIEYRDGRIFEVRDVSNETQGYFDKQNNADYIKSEIASYKK